MNRILCGLFSALLLCTLSVVDVQAQRDAHLAGHTIDKTTGEHLPFVAIAVEGTNIGTASDGSGHFILRNLPAGHQTITVSLLGYKTQSRQVEIIPGHTVEAHFELEPEAIEMNSVVVTASRNEVNKKEATSIVNVLNNKLFEQTSSANVAEALNFQSGLRVEYNCSNCGVPQLRINGLEGQYSQILLDSRPIFSSLATVYGLEQLPAGMIERVEVVRGGGSALYGSNAIGGVVNIITKDPLYNSTTLSSTVGVMEDGSAEHNTALNASLVSEDHKTGIYLFSVVKDRDAYDRNDDGFSEVPKINSETIGFRGYRKLGMRSRLTAEYHHIREFRRGGNSMDIPPHESLLAEQLRHGINGGGLRFNTYSADYRHTLDLYTSAQHIDRESYFGTDRNPDAYGTTNDITLTAGVQYGLSYDFLLPAQLTVGSEYTYNNLEDRMIGYNRIISQKSISLGTYFQNEWKTEQFGLLIGARVDKHNRMEKIIVSPRATMRWTPSEAVAFRLSYSSGYRAPQAYDEDLHVAAVGGDVAIITLSPDLRPEYSNSISGSVDLYHNFGSWESNLLIEGFHTTLDDVFALVERGHDDQGNLLLQRVNASGATISGVNFELKMGIPTFVVDAGLTLQRSLYKEALQWSEDESITPQKRMFRAPDIYGYSTITYNPTSALTLSANANFTGPMLVQHYAGYVDKDEEVLTESFVDAGLRAAYNFKLSSTSNLELSVAAKNIFDSFQKDLDVGMDKDAGYIYGPSMPRMIVGGVKITF